VVIEVLARLRTEILLVRFHPPVVVTEEDTGLQAWPCSPFLSGNVQPFPRASLLLLLCPRHSCPGAEAILMLGIHRHREGAPGTGVPAPARGQSRLAVELPGTLGQSGGAALSTHR
jgi:hypothetical protein